MDIPLFARAREFGDKTAIIATEGIFTYQYLLHASNQVATYILDDVNDLQQQRVAFLIPPGFEYVATQWGVWRAGGIAVPLCVSHPLRELEYVIADSGATIIIAQENFETILRPVAQSKDIRFILTTEMFDARVDNLPVVSTDRPAMILYTSGTTSKPKGVVTTHQNIQAQIKSLVSAWEWTSEDQILHVLPLHHIHGIINVLSCALWAGARCEMLDLFDAQVVWTRIIESELSLFMAVPTIYTKLITTWEAAESDLQHVMSNACAKLRLMVSGSAALPIQVLEKWKSISSQMLLERYGMTEIGMALSNPLHEQRLPGYVGKPLPGAKVRLVDEQFNLVEPGTPGEIQVSGSSVFLMYWGKPEATQKAFRDSWFCTGDIAVVENGSYRILGRSSVDIIKTGGYKVSALEIESVLLIHVDIQECAVVGVADPEWGQRVCAALVLIEGASLTLLALRSWAKDILAVYKIPTRILILDQLPRNAMGKVTKPEVAQLFTCE
ncbi:MAG: acyl-CoA synthetase [Rhizonema sp. PD37]|nr:acyl-CoA synthetase [Rhizonema sp. PD37]